MSDIPLSAFAPPLVGALSLAGLFGYLWLVDRQRWLGLWTAAWVLWFVRLAWGSMVGGMRVGSGDATARVLAMTYTTFVLLGTAAFSGRRLPPWWWLAAVPVLVWRILPPAPADSFEPRVVAYALVLGAGWVWAGLLFGRADPRMGLERWIPAVALCLMGIHQASIPLVARIPDYEPWAMSLTLSLQIAIGVGVLVAFGRRQRVEIEDTDRALERALTRALSGYIPICAGCKSIRDEGERWVPLESFLGSRTEASLSHGIFPRCMVELYPEYLDDEEPPGAGTRPGLDGGPASA